MQIKASTELETENKSRRQFPTSAANRKRGVPAMCAGVFPLQWSGNAPLPFYLKKISDRVGIVDRWNRDTNLGVACWQLCI